MSPSVAPRRLRVLAFVSKEVGISPGQRYRLEQWAPRLAAEHGIDVDFAPFESPELTRLLYVHGRYVEKGGRVAAGFVRRVRDVLRARSYDGAIVYREVALVGPEVYESALSFLGIPFVLDFDDAIWIHRHSKANGAMARLRFVGKTAAIARMSSAVTVGNEYLASFARRHASSVHVVPTTIELDRYPVLPESSVRDRLVVVWSGTVHTLAHFETARAALEKFAARHPLRVRVIADKPPERPIAGAENEFVRWSSEGEANAVGDSHVGIMPLPDDDYSRGKCGLKALQYMATGRPVVVSPVGMNSDLVRDAENGFLARDDEGWVHALERLAASAELRATLGAEARRTVERGYSSVAASRVFARVLRASFDPGAPTERESTRVRDVSRDFVDAGAPR